jgi:hypothetical protein
MEDNMRRGAVHVGAVLAALFSVFSGCVAVVDRPSDQPAVESDRHGPPPWAPAYGYRRQHDTYYYYPASQVYYYPSVRRYYWLEGREWRYGDRLPRRYAIEEDKRVALDLDYEPHTQHAKIKEMYPPDYYERDNRSGKYR